MLHQDVYVMLLDVSLQQEGDTVTQLDAKDPVHHLLLAVVGKCITYQSR